MTQVSKTSIIVICGDPGGANAIVPVVKKMKSMDIGDIHIFAYRHACKVMEDQTIHYSVADEQISDLSINNLFTELQPGIIITGTSFNSIDLEKKFIRIARERKIPSISILDYWSNYSIRFSDNEGLLKFLPDKIAIMDQRAFDDMVSECFPPERLVITGQPAFDALWEIYTQFNGTQRLKIRAGLNIPPDSLFIVFMSQPFSAIYGNDESNPLYPGYTEKTVLTQLIPILEQLSLEHNKKLTLLIRPHPREESSDFNSFFSKNIYIFTSKEGNPREIVMASDLVVGINSEILVEACYLGCIVASIQPGLRFKDCLPTNLLGYSIPIYRNEEIYERIQTALLDQEFRSRIARKLHDFKPDGNATQNIVDLIIHMIQTINYN